jgi:hypothetical protein
MNILKRIFSKKEDTTVISIVNEKMYYINNYIGGKETDFHCFAGKWHESEDSAKQESIDLHKKLTYRYVPVLKSISESEVEKIKRGTNMTIKEALECMHI